MTYNNNNTLNMNNNNDDNSTTTNARQRRIATISQTAIAKSAAVALVSLANQKPVDKFRRRMKLGNHRRQAGYYYSSDPNRAEKRRTIEHKLQLAVAMAEEEKIETN